MKRFTRCICFLLVCVTMLSTTAFAAEVSEPRVSMFFAGSSVYFWNTSGRNYEIWFNVTSVSTMQKLGASQITVQRSTDNANWTTVRNYCNMHKKTPRSGAEIKKEITLDVSANHSDSSRVIS